MPQSQSPDYVIHPSETLEVLNQRLIDYFGRFENNWAKWKLFFSEDFFEKRMVYSTKDGFELLSPVVEIRRKAEYISNRYILCRIVPVPEIQQFDLCGAKWSYEPVWTFEDEFGTMPVQWEAIQVLINIIESAVGKGPIGYAKYKQSEEEIGQSKEAIEHRIKVIQEQLFGNESAITDALSLDSGVGYGTRQRKDWLN